MICEFEESTENVKLATRLLGAEPSLIAKTLAFRNKDHGFLIVMKGDARIDNKKFRQNFGIKAKMISYDEVFEGTGYPVGGGCLLGLKHNILFLFDISLRKFPKVYPAAGSTNSCIELNPKELFQITDPKWVDICKG